MRSFSHIGLYGRTFNDVIVHTLKTLLAHLEEQGYRVCVEEKTANALSLKDYSRFSTQHMPTNIELMLVVGGDGSMLDAAHKVIQHQIPLLGVNRGNLGFLTDIYPESLEDQLNSILSGEYSTEQRFMLHVDHKGYRHYALNEFTVSAHEGPQLMGYEIYVDGKLMCHQRSDGLIIATPTGSTAYALSGGGPILHPSLNAMVLVPMFPHTLTMRPIVISGDSTITLRITSTKTISVRIGADSQHDFILPKEEILTIQKEPTPLILVHPLSYNYYDSLRSKLHWAKSPVSIGSD